jgi:putative NADH-flavin reductase
MKLLVLGATGRIGRLAVDEAVRRGHHVTALVRSPDRSSDAATSVRILQGDVLHRDAVADALAGQDAVIYAVGAGNVRTTTLFSESTRVLVEAMSAHGVRRVVCVTGVGAGETKGHGGFLYDRILYPLFTKGIYADKDRQEALLRASDTDWTIVRPAAFRKRIPDGPLRVVTDVGSIVLRKIAVTEAAVFLLDEMEQGRYIRQTVFIGHE